MSRLKFVYVVVSSEQDPYADQAILSMHSLKLQHPDGHITLLTDKATLDGLAGFRAKIKEYADEIVAVDMPADLSSRKRSRYIKTSMRRHVQGDFLFIDSDTIITGPLYDVGYDESIDVGAVISRHVNPWSSRVVHPLIKKVLVARGINAADEPPIEHYYNTGVIFCRDSAKAREFFEMWHLLWLEYQEYHDQPDFWRADARMRCLVKPLDGRYNCQLLYEGSANFIDTCSVFHYFATSNSQEWIPFKKVDFIEKLRAEGITDGVENKIRGIIDEWHRNPGYPIHLKHGNSPAPLPKSLRFRLYEKLMATPAITWIWRVYNNMKLPYWLEIHLADHCDLGCKSCSHYSPIAPKRFETPEGLRKSLAVLKKRGVTKFFDEIHLMGGEPLLNPQIAELIRITRDAFAEVPIIILTNGKILSDHADRLSDSFWQACRECKVKIEVTRYPAMIDYDKIEAICQREGVEAEIFRDRSLFGEFLLFRLFEDGRGHRSNFYKCVENRYWQLRGDKIYGCAQNAYVDILNNRFGTKFKTKKRDYIEITKASRLRFFLFRLLSKPFCRYCEYPRPVIEWERSRRCREEWISD